MPLLVTDRDRLFSDHVHVHGTKILPNGTMTHARHQPMLWVKYGVSHLPRHLVGTDTQYLGNYAGSYLLLWILPKCLGSRPCIFMCI